jgi:hypothetical protein
MLLLTESLVALPVLSCAGVNRALLLMIRHVALSSDEEPLELVTEQFVTRPSGPTSRRKPVTPCSPARMAESG